MNPTQTVVIAISFTLLCVMKGCVTRNDSIFVKSGGHALKEPMKFAFYLAQYEKENLLDYGDRQRVANFCAKEIQNAGYGIVSDTVLCTDGCYIIGISLAKNASESYRTTPTYTTPTQTNCRRGYGGSVSCTTTGSNTYGGRLVRDIYFTKYAKFWLVDPTTEKFDTVREIRTALTSEHSSIGDLTAEYFCRGLIAGLQRDVEGDFDLPPRGKASPSLLELIGFQ